MIKQASYLEKLRRLLVFKEIYPNYSELYLVDAAHIETGVFVFSGDRKSADLLKLD